MKIILINSPIRLNAKPNNIPYGLATIASTLRINGFDVEIYDINALRPSMEDTIRCLKGKSWDLVGLSGLITTYKFQKWLIPELKKINPNAPVISGGGLATSSSDLVFKHTPVDITVLGEGEQTMVELCQTIKEGKNLGEVPGIRFRQNGRVVENVARNNIEDLDSIPFPSWDLLPIDIYLKNPIWGDDAENSSKFRKDVKVTRSMNIISSRGCPFGCNYCYHLFGRSNYRFRSTGNVIEEIEVLVGRYGVDFIGFVDDNMMASEKRLLEFCDLIERKNFSITWGCHGRITSARLEVLRRMAEVGCVWIGYGIESGSQKMLNKMNKQTGVEAAKVAIRATRKAGIHANTTFIFGYPGENSVTVDETIAFKRELGLECGSFFATPYPGTPLYEEIKNRVKDENAFIESLGEATGFVMNLTEFSDEYLLEQKKKYDLKQNP